MTKRVWQNRLVTGVLVALVSLVGLADFLPHTDDGCAVEVHCVACRAHLGKVAGVALSSVVLARANEFIALETIRGEAAKEAPTRLFPPGRAPPLSA